MARYLSRRLLLMIPTFFGITLITFAVAHLAPGDPLSLQDENMRSGGEEATNAFRQVHGLDQPLPIQYVRWMGRVLTLDFGRSTQDQRMVIDKIGEALPRTMLLSILALLISYAIAIPLGVLSAVKQRSPLERAMTIGLFLLYSMPSFWVAVMLLLALTREQTFDLFPMQGLVSEGYDQLSAGAKLRDLVWHLVLPVTCLSYASLASISRYMRSGMLEVIRQDYIRTARAKGLSERAVILKHALRNALIPIITLLGLMLPNIIGGSVIVERVFGIPGMGELALESIFSRDYPMVMGITTLVAIVTMVAMLLSDLLYAVADPRISLRSEG
jgi:peptide/nickel transport system permease protein